MRQTKNISQPNETHFPLRSIKIHPNLLKDVFKNIPIYSFPANLTEVRALTKRPFPFKIHLKEGKKHHFVRQENDMPFTLYRNKMIGSTRRTRFNIPTYADGRSLGKRWTAKPNIPISVVNICIYNGINNKQEGIILYIPTIVLYILVFRIEKPSIRFFFTCIMFLKVRLGNA